MHHRRATRHRRHPVRYIYLFLHRAASYYPTLTLRFPKPDSPHVCIGVHPFFQVQVRKDEHLEYKPKEYTGTSEIDCTAHPLRGLSGDLTTMDWESDSARKDIENGTRLEYAYSAYTAGPFPHMEISSSMVPRSTSSASPYIILSRSCKARFETIDISALESTSMLSGEFRWVGQAIGKGVRNI